MEKKLWAKDRQRKSTSMFDSTPPWCGAICSVLSMPFKVCFLRSRDKCDVG